VLSKAALGKNLIDADELEDLMDETDKSCRRALAA
jgi:hypothetical protein